MASTEQFMKEAVGNLDVVTPYRQLVAETTGRDSLYIKAKETLLSYFEQPENTLSVREKTEMLSKLITDITVQTTDRLMSIALQAAVENRDAGYKLAKEREATLLIQEQTNKVAEDIRAQTYQVDVILPKEASKLDAEILYTGTKTTELTADGLKDRAVKDKQIDKLVEDIAYTNEQTSVLVANSAKDLLIKDAQIGKANSDKALIDAQEAEIHLNAESNRAVKSKDLEVKDAQKELYIRQKQSLNDSLLKDLYKEASGGTAMVYSELDGTISTPNSWNQVDEIANQILTSAGSNYQFTVANS